MTTCWRMASSTSEPVALVDERSQRLVGHEQQDVVHRRPLVGPAVLALGQLAHPGAHVAHERGPVCRALGLVARVEVAQVGRHRELDVHEQHVALGQEEREVGDAGALALDGGAGARS